MDPRLERQLPRDVQQQVLRQWLLGAWRQRGVLVTWLTVALLASGAVQGLADSWLSDDGGSRWLLALAHIPLEILHGQWWRLVTSTWVHSDAAHLLVNAMMLWIVGRPVEAAYGTARMGLIWTGAVLASGIAMLANPMLQPTIGSSGGVFGLVGALLGLGIKLLPRLDRRLRWSMVGVPGLCLLALIAMGGPRADLPAHLGGALGGLTMGVALRPQFLPLSPLTRRRLAAGWVRGLAWAALLLQGMALAFAGLHANRALDIPRFPSEHFEFNGVRLAYPAGTRRGTFHLKKGTCSGDLTDGAWALRTGRMPCWPLPLSGVLVVARREQLFSMDEGDWRALRESAATGTWVSRQTGVLLAALPQRLVAVIFAEPPLLPTYRGALASLVPAAGSVAVDLAAPETPDLALPAAATGLAVPPTAPLSGDASGESGRGSKEGTVP